MADEIVRPFTPNRNLDIETRKLLATEHIAQSLSAIDHNLERFVKLFQGYYQTMAQKK